MPQKKNYELQLLLRELKFPEGPRWHEERLYFSDFYGQKVIAVDLSGNSETILILNDYPSGLGWLPDGRLSVVSVKERQLIHLDPEGFKESVDLKELVPHPCNDMVIDSQGKAFIGHMGYDFFNNAESKMGDLICVAPNGDARIVADNLAFPNGMIIFPDRETLVIAESWASRLTAFDIQEDGSLSNRRVWAELQNAVPDGICLDAEGGIWVASPSSSPDRWASSEVIRVLEGGEVTDRVKISNHAVACMLGGEPVRDILFICSVTVNAENGQVQSGRIDYREVEIPGAGRP